MRMRSEQRGVPRRSGLGQGLDGKEQLKVEVENLGCQPLLLWVWQKLLISRHKTG